MPSAFHRVFAWSLVVALCVPTTALAHPVGPRDPYVVTVEDDGGQSLPTFHHRGRTYVLGVHGTRYNVRIENRTRRRVEAVLSVDGRDAVSGRKGDYVEERGYVVDPWSEVVVEGFRSTHHDVAAFRFTDPANSYSARMGTPENVGVIGVAFFPERVRHARRWWLPEQQQRPEAPRRRDATRPGRAAHGASAESAQDTAADGFEGAPKGEAAGAASAYRPSAPRSAPRRESHARQNLGTEYGERLSSPVHEVTFQRAHARRPAQLVTLHYDDHAGLRARGIRIHRPHPVVDRGPQPFPGRRFAPPPP